VQLRLLRQAAAVVMADADDSPKGTGGGRIFCLLLLLLLLHRLHLHSPLPTTRNWGVGWDSGRIPGRGRAGGGGAGEKRAGQHLG
jgi:hypothetical protein